jgi:hypothetical protein
MTEQTDNLVLEILRRMQSDIAKHRQLLSHTPIVRPPPCVLEEERLLCASDTCPNW